MTTQVPPDFENKVAPPDYSPFTTGYAQYPPAQHQPEQHAISGYSPFGEPPMGGGQPGYSASGDQQGYRNESYPTAVDLPSTHLRNVHPAGDHPAVSYPQEGGGEFPVPVPYPQPGAHSPQAAYSTAPPWAAVQPAPASSGPDSPADEPVPHGGLLVPFPDAMQHAGRAQAPAVWPVAVFTLLFGIFGAISASRRAGQARRSRNSTAPYWIAFLVSFVVGAFCWFVVETVVVGPLVSEIQEGQRVEAVQHNLVGNDRLRDARINVTAAQCRAVADRNATGMRDYLCRLTLDDGHTATLALTADKSGEWHSGTGR